MLRSHSLFSPLKINQCGHEIVAEATWMVIAAKVMETPNTTCHLKERRYTYNKGDT